MTAGPPLVRLRTLLVLLLGGILGAGVLAGCRTSLTTPYAWQPTAEDPRILIRVPEGTPGSEAVPKEERLHRNGWATQVGEVETPDPRWSCCPETEAEEAEWKRNELSLFIGFTGVRAGDGGTAGLMYTRALQRNFGLAVFGEYVFGKEQVPVVGAGVIIRPNERAMLLFAGGAEFVEGETSALFRFGASYRVATVRRLSISPAVYLDLIENRAPVILLGVEIGREF